MRINHQVVVFDAADLTAESAFWAVTSPSQARGGARQVSQLPQGGCSRSPK